MFSGPPGDDGVPGKDGNGGGDGNPGKEGQVLLSALPPKEPCIICPPGIQGRRFIYIIIV